MKNVEKSGSRGFLFGIGFLVYSAIDTKNTSFKAGYCLPMQIACFVLFTFPSLCLLYNVCDQLKLDKTEKKKEKEKQMK